MGNRSWKIDLTTVHSWLNILEKHMDAHEQDVQDCCSLVLDIAEREIFGVRETAADGVDEEIREEGILRQLDRIVQLIVTISPHIDRGDATLRYVIDVRQSVREEVEASIVRQGRH